MAEVVLATASQRQVWSNTFWKEYIRESGFSNYMSRQSNAIFRILGDLDGKGGGIVNVPLLGRLKGRGVEGSEVLEGNEEDLENFNDQVRITWIRNGVVVPKSTSYLTELDLLGAAKAALKDWRAEKLRDRIIAALQSIIIPGATDENGLPGTDTSVAYASATAGQRNTFLVNNADRILFGALKSNASSGVWATALATIDNTADKLSTSMISTAKRIAKTADPHIRPFRIEDGREYFVLFSPSLPFRDLQLDSAMQQANRDARERGIDNPIFQGGDLIWDSVIIREIPELPVIAGAGAGGIDVAVSYLCGQGAVALAWGQGPTPQSDMDRDYRFRPGVAMEELTGQKKVSWGGKMYGVVELVTAAVADA